MSFDHSVHLRGETPVAKLPQECVERPLIEARSTDPQPACCTIPFVEKAVVDRHRRTHITTHTIGMRIGQRLGPKTGLDGLATSLHEAGTPVGGLI